jgi:hypothetical protein
MTDADLTRLFVFMGLIYVVWTAALLSATLYLHRLACRLIEERRELRRWRRLQGLASRQRQPWN